MCLEGVCGCKSSRFARVLLSTPCLWFMFLMTTLNAVYAIANAILLTRCNGILYPVEAVPYEFHSEFRPVHPLDICSGFHAVGWWRDARYGGTIVPYFQVICTLIFIIHGTFLAYAFACFTLKECALIYGLITNFFLLLEYSVISLEILGREYGGYIYLFTVPNVYFAARAVIRVSRAQRKEASDAHGAAGTGQPQSLEAPTAVEAGVPQNGLGGNAGGNPIAVEAGYAAAAKLPVNSNAAAVFPVTWPLLMAGWRQSVAYKAEYRANHPEEAGGGGGCGGGGGGCGGGD